MSVKFTELWRLSRVAYKEVSFQSIFSLRAGAALPHKGRGSVEQLVKNAATNTLISKLITTLFVAIFGFSVFFPVTFSVAPLPVSRELAVAAAVSAFLAVVLFLITMMGLQVATSFVSSKIVEIISPLPLSKRDISRVVFLTFVRIFDIPLGTSVVVLLLAYGLSGGSFLGGLVSFVGIVVTEVFALVLTIGLAKFFYARIAGGGGRSRWKTVLRFVFMAVWILPSLGIYLVLNFATQIVESFVSVTEFFRSFLQFLVLVYPFSFGFLVSFLTNFESASIAVFGLALVAFAVYVVLGAYSLRWVTEAIRRIGVGGVVGVSREPVRDTLVRPQVQWLAMIRKDVRMASRSPSYASLFLLPAVETIVLAMSFSSLGGVSFISMFGLLLGISSVTLLLPPMLLALEGQASAYTRSLPLRKSTLVSAKAILATLTYSVSLIVLAGVAVYLHGDFLFILIFGAVHALSIAAASMLELLILARKFWREGFAVGNLYARLSTYILVLIPGVAVALLPMIVAVTMYFIARNLALGAFLVAALLEFSVMALVTHHEK